MTKVAFRYGAAIIFGLVLLIWTSGTGNGAVLPPTVTKAFGAATIPLNGTTTVSFNVANPNAVTALTRVSFIDTLPAGLVVATPDGVSGVCTAGSGGSVLATSGGGAIEFTGILAANGSCQISVHVTGTTTGFKVNSVTVEDADAGTGNTATATLTVQAAPTSTFTPTATTTSTTTATPTGTPTRILGDFNGDGVVDIRDYGVWRQNFGQGNCGNPADADGNCLVDIRDYGIWRQHFGEGTPADQRGSPPRAEVAPAPQHPPGPAPLAGAPAAEGSWALPPAEGSRPAAPIIPVVGGLLGLGGVVEWWRRRPPRRE